MTRTLDSGQNALVARSDLHIITLVKITTYTDRASKSVPVEFYLSDKPVIYDYGNLGTDRHFWSVVGSFEPFVRQMQHVPSPDDLSPYSDTLRITFSNQEFHGRRLITLLRDQNLIGADIEMSEFAVTSLGSYPIDLSSEPGDEHTVHFQGVVRSIDSITNAAFILNCFVEMPSTIRIWDQDKTNGPNVHPRHRGGRLPILYGKSEPPNQAEAFLWNVGAFTTLAQTLTSGADNVDIATSSVEGVPTSGTFTIRIGNEDITCSWGTGKIHIDNGGRGANGTDAVSHTHSETVMVYAEDTEIIYTNHIAFEADVGGFALNPTNRELIQVGAWDTVADNREVVPGTEAGVATLTPAGLAGLLDNLRHFNPAADFDVEWFLDIGFSMRLPDTGGVQQLGAAVTVVDDMDGTASDWSASSFASEVDDSTDFVKGTGSVKFTTSAGAGNSANRDFSPGLDLTGVCLSFYVKFDQAFVDAMMDDDPFHPWMLYMYSADSTDDDYKRTRLPVDMLRPGVWQRFFVSPENSDDFGTVGAFDITDITRIRFAHLFGAGSAGAVVKYDDITYATNEHHYEGDPGDSLMNHPIDFLVNWIEHFGFEHIDETTRALAVTAIDDNEYGGDMRPLGYTWGEVAQHLAYFSRLNLIPEYTSNGRVWKFLGADQNYKFPAPTFYLTEFGGCVDIGRDLEELATNFKFRYDFRPALGGSEESYSKVIVANPQNSDVTMTAEELETARGKIGDRELPQQFFRNIADEDTAKELAGYFVQELSDADRSVLQITEVPWTQGYERQLGDIIEVTPPWMKFPDSQISALDDETDWTDVDFTASNNTTTFRDGSGSVDLNSDGANDFGAMFQDFDPFDLRDRAVTIWIYTPAAELANVEAVHLYFGSTAEMASDFVRHDLPIANLVSDGWAMFRVAIGVDADEVDGDYDPTHTISVQIGYTQDSVTGSRNLTFDDLRIASRTIPVRIISISKSFASQHFDITAVEVETV
jgi:hypothetical protein